MNTTLIQKYKNEKYEAQLYRQKNCFVNLNSMLQDQTRVFTF